MLPLNSLEIMQFRGYEHLVVDRLGRVNLLVGKNNIGKSAFLEALRIYANQGSPSVILDILRSRNEDTANPATNPDGDDSSRLAFWNLVHGWRGAREFQDPIVIGPKDALSEQVSISFAWYSPVPVEQEVGGVTYKEVDLTGEHGDDARPALSIRLGGVLKRRLFLDQSAQSLRRRLLYREQTEGIPCTHVASNGFGQEQSTLWWSRVTLTDLEEDVLHALRLVEPDLVRFNMVEGAEGERTFIVRLKDWSKPALLRSMGEGMTRMLSITLALVNARGGLMLVDEIENGIHYSVQYEMWKFILGIARRLDVQVFATTHSSDCVRAFQEAASEDRQENGALIRLTKKHGKVVATVFDEHDLEVATRQQIEVR